MPLIKDIKPAKKFGPSYFIKERMELMSFTIDDLIFHLKISRVEAVEILETNKPISAEFATRLSELFKTSVQYWLRLDLNYRQPQNH